MIQWSNNPSAPYDQYVEPQQISYTNPAVLQPKVINGLGKRGCFRNPIYANYYYALSSGPWDVNGIYVGGHLQSWYLNDSTPAGYYRVHWEAFIQLLANATAVDYKVMMDSITYLKLDLNNVIIRIDTLNYLCQKAEIEMPFPSVCKFALVRI